MTDRMLVRIAPAVAVAGVTGALAFGSDVVGAARGAADAWPFPSPTSATTATSPERAPTDLRRAGQQDREQRAGAGKQRRHEPKARALRQQRAAETRAARSAQRGFAGDPGRIAATMAAGRYGWGADQFSCLDALWAHESGWDHTATNPRTGAYGIPQALPGAKMAAYGGDWRTNPVTQIEWGLAYIAESYGTPCGAWRTFERKAWY